MKRSLFSMFSTRSDSNRHESLCLILAQQQLIYWHVREIATEVYLCLRSLFSLFITYRTAPSILVRYWSSFPLMARILSTHDEDTNVTFNHCFVPWLPWNPVLISPSIRAFTSPAYTLLAEALTAGIFTRPENYQRNWWFDHADKFAKCCPAVIRSNDH